MMNHKMMTANDVNVEEGERWLSAIAGVVLALVGLGKKSPLGALLALAGGYLVYRGVSGHCFVYEMMGKAPRPSATILPADAAVPPSVNDGDEVMESSWESFPTSDAPSWTMGRERDEPGR